jgi:hypothetical protein
MKGEFFVYKPGHGEPERTVIDGEPTLEALQGAIGGGDLEAIQHFTKLPDGRPCVAFCDEHGKLKELPVNDAATAIWHAHIERVYGRPAMNAGYLDTLRGWVLCVTGDAEFMGLL